MCDFGLLKDDIYNLKDNFLLKRDDPQFQYLITI